MYNSCIPRSFARAQRGQVVPSQRTNYWPNFQDPSRLRFHLFSPVFTNEARIFPDHHFENRARSHTLAWRATSFPYPYPPPPPHLSRPPIATSNFLLSRYRPLCPLSLSPVYDNELSSSWTLVIENRHRPTGQENGCQLEDRGHDGAKRSQTSSTEEYARI